VADETHWGRPKREVPRHLFRQCQENPRYLVRGVGRVHCPVGWLQVWIVPRYRAGKRSRAILRFCTVCSSTRSRGSVVRREVSRWEMKRRILLHAGGLGVVGSVMQDGRARRQPSSILPLVTPIEKRYGTNILDGGDPAASDTQPGPPTAVRWHYCVQ
jgi:hypothetical protein